MKSDVLHFFRDAGAEACHLDELAEEIADKTVITSLTKTSLTRTVLIRLDEAREAGRGARLAIVRQVIQFDDFSRCWGHDVEPARRLIKKVARLAKSRTSFRTKNAFDRRIFWIATPRSMRGNRVSVLAVVETLVAMALSVTLYFYTGSLSHILVASAIALILLLQTPLSTKCALKMAYAATNAIERRYEGGHEVRVTPLVFQLIALVVLWVTKFVALLYTVIRSPIYSLWHVPDNWRKLILFTDLLGPPEPIPYFLRFAATGPWGLVRDSMYRFSMGHNQVLWYVFARSGACAFHLPPGVIFLLTLLVLIPTILYRLAIKSTALIWSPLLWAFRPIRTLNNIEHFARGVIGLGANKVLRGFSIVVIALGALKGYIWLYWYDLAATLRAVPGWTDIESYILPNSVAGWHIAALVNACLTWWLYVRATRLVHDISGGAVVPTGPFQNFVRVTFTFRNILSVYISSCLLYITFWIVTDLEFPPLHIIVFPW